MTVMYTGGEASNETKPKAGVYVEKIPISPESTRADVCKSFATSVRAGECELWILGNVFMHAARKRAGSPRKDPEIFRIDMAWQKSACSLGLASHLDGTVHGGRGCDIAWVTICFTGPEGEGHQRKPNQNLVYTSIKSGRSCRLDSG